MLVSCIVKCESRMRPSMLCICAPAYTPESDARFLNLHITEVFFWRNASSKNVCAHDVWCVSRLQAGAKWSANKRFPCNRKRATLSEDSRQVRLIINVDGSAAFGTLRRASVSRAKLFTVNWMDLLKLLRSNFICVRVRIRCPFGAYSFLVFTYILGK